MISVYSVLYTLVLFSELSSHPVTATMPATKAEDGAADQDGLGFLLGDEPMTEPAAVPPGYWQSRMPMGSKMRDDDGSPLVSDTRLRGFSIRGLSPALARSLPLLSERSLSHSPAEHSLKIDRRNTDLDMLRCMIGRVYRPCWEA